MSLDELAFGLTHFLPKEKLQKTIDRQLRRLDENVQRLRRGDAAVGSKRHLAKRVLEGGPHALAKAQKKIRDQAKTDLRLWSPARYIDGAERGTAGVLAISCLVLDIDGGVSLGEVDARLAPHHRIFHSTWSHQKNAPRFRVCLPLAQPVDAACWTDVWGFAQARVGGVADGALKGPAATYALPATPDETGERFAFVRPGPCFDPVRDGLAEGIAINAPPRARESHFRGAEKLLPPLDESPPTDWDAEFDAF